MSKSLYWVKHNPPKKVKDFLGKHEIEINRTLECDDNRVDKVWFYGGPGKDAESPVICYFSALLKNGIRVDEKIDADEDWIEQAENILKQHLN